MKKMLVACISIATVISMSITALAEDYSYRTPAEITAELTERSVDDIIKEIVETGKAFSTIAEEAGKIKEFKEESLKSQEAVINSRVESGLISQNEADQILSQFKSYQDNYNGYGYGYGYGYGCGMGMGMGYGGCGRGMGYRAY